MIRQYYPQRHCIGTFGRPVGTIAAGAIFRVTDSSRGIERYVDTVMVEAWLPRDYAVPASAPVTTARTSPSVSAAGTWRSSAASGPAGATGSPTGCCTPRPSSSSEPLST